MELPSLLPVLPIRNAVIFPGASMPLVVGRPKSLEALHSSRAKDSLIVIVAQKVMSSGDPRHDDLYRIGTLCKIESIVETDTSSFQLVVSGISRYRIAEFVEKKNFIAVRGESIADRYGQDPSRTRALFNSLKHLAKEILDLLPTAGEPLTKLIDKLEDPSYLTNLCATYLNISIAEKQALLEETVVDLRMESLLDLMQKEREVLNIQKDIQEKMSERLNRAQREALLREQMRTIKEELGDDGESISDEVAKKLANAKLPPEVKKITEEELKRLENLPPASAEYHVIRTYLDWIAELPWEKATPDRLDIPEARKILDQDHFGLEPVKKRILQFLAVAKLKLDAARPSSHVQVSTLQNPPLTAPFTSELHGPILCLIGPPGVGKTSLGQSMARALGRKFIRASLGGVRDEAEIRGHRRTYIGAMPGRIIQSLRRVGVNNPLFMLDEIDKLGNSFQGDPAAAMLEVLDPEQNRNFVDHYLDVAFNLSNVFFVATANVADTIPPPLRDRMEFIEIDGYTNLEKLHIAKQYLIPKQLKEHGITTDQVKIPDETILEILSHYTREAGVRELQREIAALMRAGAEHIVEGKILPFILNRRKTIEILGPEKFFPEVHARAAKTGIATGLAWTPHGGDILFIEATLMPGSGKLILTGQLGDVMKESAQIAMSIIRAGSMIPFNHSFDKEDVHIHVPAGAIPKDGPSAGVTLLLALASLFTGKALDPKLAMTGEITLRGAVLPVGGIKQKIFAAHRAGIEKVLIPKRNEPDLSEIPNEVRSKIKISFIESAEEALSEGLDLILGPSQELVRGMN